LLKKVILLLLALVTFISSTAFASFTVVKSGGLGSASITRNHPHMEDIRYSPDFKENGTTFRFSGWYYKGDHTDNISFDKGWKDKWHVTRNWYEPYLGHKTMQIQDDATGRLFYTLSDNYDAAYILGYDFGSKKVIQYVNSDNYYSPYTGFKKIEVRNGELYLIFKPFRDAGYSGNESGDPIAYRLYWDASANWFGYEDVGTDF
jgi:hypothetical protein